MPPLLCILHTASPLLRKISYWTCQYVSLHGKADFADVTKGPGTGKLSWIQWVGSISHNDSQTKSAGGLASGKGRDTGDRQRERERDLKMPRDYFEDGGGAMSQGCGQPPDTGKGKETDSPSDLPEWMQLCWNLSHLRLISDFDFRNRQMINLCCFKPPDLLEQK